MNAGSRCVRCVRAVFGCVRLRFTGALKLRTSRAVCCARMNAGSSVRAEAKVETPRYSLAILVKKLRYRTTVLSLFISRCSSLMRVLLPGLVLHSLSHRCN